MILLQKIWVQKTCMILNLLIEKQISTQYRQALDSITKKEILDQIEKLHKIELPKNLVRTRN